MQLSVTNNINTKEFIDLLIIPIHHCKNNNISNINSLKIIEKTVDIEIIKKTKKLNFFGEKGKFIFLKARIDLLLIGMGMEKNINIQFYKNIAAKIAYLSDLNSYQSICFYYNLSSKYNQKQYISSIIYGVSLARYEFKKYKINYNLTNGMKKIIIFSKNLIIKDFKDIKEKIKSIINGIFLTRDLINEGSSFLTPQKFSQITNKITKKLQLNTEILDETLLKKKEMNLMINVARASIDQTPPRLIKISYSPENKDASKIILIGKGLTFDSGGLNLKSSAGLRNMKIDMSGAATVLGTMIAIEEIAPPVQIIGYLACAENGIGPKSYHPGDIIKSRNGIHVEIDNTDAEGRLVLADVIDLAQEEEKDIHIIIDIATLTGASVISLGPTTGSLFSNNTKIANNLYYCSQKVGEKLWRMPLDEDLISDLNSHVADIKNCGSGYGGSITAALFLKQFIKNDINWIHLDIAGPASTEKGNYYTKKGGTGFIVATLVEFISQK